MSTRCQSLSHAKQLYRDGKYQMCKTVLLDILKEDKKNEMILIKLGDVSSEMNEFKEAESFYQECLIINNLNEKCLFQYAQLLVKMNEYKKAEKYFLKCLQIDQKACVHYHYGLILSKYLSNINQAIFHLKQSTIIQPNVTKYHYEYAMMLKASNQYKDANKSFLKALELSDYSDAFIIYEYSQFLYQCMNDKQNALNFAELAAAHDPKYSLKLKKHVDTQSNNEIEETYIHSDTVHNINYTKLKYIVYDMSAISYFDLNKETNGNLHNLRLMYIEDFVVLFGGRDRINRLSQHFQRILSKNIRIGAFIRKYDKDYQQMVIESLKKAYLDQYIQFVGDIQFVVNFKIDNKLSYDEMLLITIKDQMEQNQICQIFNLPKEFGLTLNNLERIEQNIGIELKPIYTTFKTNITSMSGINYKIYNDIKHEILKSHYGSTDVNKLQVIQWMNTHWTNNKQQLEHKLMFEEFAQKFLYVCCASAQHQVWIAYNILMPLLAIEPQDPDLIGKKALFLTHLGRSKEADETYKKSLSYSRFITTYVNYAYLLFKEHRNEECERVFKQALELNPISKKAIVGCARIVAINRKIDEAVYYHKKSIALYSNDDLVHCRYGTLLLHYFRDYAAALHHFSIAEQIFANSHKTQYWIGMTYLKMGNMVEFKNHLSYALKINPKHENSLKEWTRHFGEYNPKSIETDTKQFVLNGYGRIKRFRTKEYEEYSAKEFAIFWYHKSELFLIEDYYGEFQHYYQLFMQHKMNSIWKLFDIDKKILNEQIGIKNEHHIDIILECIEKNVIMEYEDFKNWMKLILFDKTLLQLFMDLFAEHTVYSMDSFYRNMPSEQKLIKILGPQHAMEATTIWNSFYSK